MSKSRSRGRNTDWSGRNGQQVSNNESYDERYHDSRIQLNSQFNM
jgi:hypothetical protein